MAQTHVGGGERSFKIDRFFGVNEAPDGDTGLNMGEAAVMRNFRITKEGNLQKRPGYKTVLALAADRPVRGMWHGYVNGVEQWLAACGGHIYSVGLTAFEASDLGGLTDAPTCFFGFGGKVYILNGSEYKVWDGTSLSDVAGYVPVIATATPPAGGGTALEQVNKLTGKKRQRFSPDGSATAFQLAETGVTSIDTVRVNGSLVTAGFTRDTTAGIVTFSTAPAAGTNTIEIAWTKGAGDRATIAAQKYAELYNGYTDNRVFLYGDGTNKAYYSGLDENGLPSAEYFPDLNVLDVGTGNTPITSMIRHFNKLMVFKTDGAYLSDFDMITLTNGAVTAGFYTSGIDRDTGNAAPGQVRLVNNCPVSLHGNSAYRWGLIYTSGVQDERAARRISDGVGASLAALDVSRAITFDDEYSREYWIVQGGTALIWNYAGEVDQGKNYKSNTWSIYTDIPATCFVQIGGAVFFGSAGGTIEHLSADYRSDNGSAIDCYWESGSMSFGAEHADKVLRCIYTALKPEVGARIAVTLQTDRQSVFEEKIIGSNVYNYAHWDYAHLSYNVNRKPQIRRTKLKAKKFRFLKLIFSSLSSAAGATVLSCTLPVAATGRSK